MYWCSSGSTWWCTQLLAAYISHWRGLGSPFIECSPFAPRQPDRNPTPEPGIGLVAHDEVGVVAEAARAVGVHEGGQLEAPGELHQHLLERLALAGGRHHGHAHRVAGPVELRDRPVEHRHHVVALEVGRVGQHQVGERGHLRLERVAHDDEGDLVVPAGVAVVQHPAHFRRVHGRVPRHVRHEDHQRVDAVRIPAPRVGDHVVHQAMDRERVLPREGLVDAHRPAVVVEEEVVGRGGPAQGLRDQRLAGLHRLLVVGRARAGRHRARERRLVAEAARAIDGAQQRHEDRERADGMEAVGVRREPAHRVERDRPAGHARVLHAPGIGPARSATRRRDRAPWCPSRARAGGSWPRESP